MLAFQMRIEYFTLFFLILSFNSLSQKKTFKEYNQKIGGIDLNLKMVPVNGGEFSMGNPEFNSDEFSDNGPVHQVYLDSFWIGKYEITWDIYHLFMSREIDVKQIQMDVDNEINKNVDAVSSATPPYVEMSFGMGTDGYPAISMTQYAASKFCEWLSAMTGNYYRLPTEAEWEFACRSGSVGSYSFGELEKINEYAWYIKNSDGKYQKVGSKKPNSLGIHDMHGNVSEWTLDEYNPKGYYLENDSIIKNPIKFAKKLYPRVVRGGSFMDDADKLKSYSRLASNKKWKKQDPQIPRSLWWHTDAQFLGFRIVRPYKTPSRFEQDKYWLK